MLAKKTIPAGSVCWNRTRRRCSKTAIWAPGAKALYTGRGRPPSARGLLRAPRARRGVAGAHREGGCPRRGVVRPIRPIAHVLAHLGDREMQPPLPLLHAGGRRAAAAQGRPALLRGDRAPGGAVRAVGRTQDPPHGRGAAGPTWNRRSGRENRTVEGARPAAAGDDV